MFERIAPRYDFLNRLLSLGRDVCWRARLVDALPAGKGLRVLDAATGTADVLVALAKQRGGEVWTMGLDAAPGMLALGRDKLRRARPGAPSRLVCGDAQRMPLRDGVFDAVTMAFGIRNMADPDGALSEMRRVLRPGGRALILEFSMPQNRPLRAVYLLYLRHVLPVIGGSISGDFRAYRYLNRSVEAFPGGERFRRMLESAGFIQVAARALTGGVATLYVAEKRRDLPSLT